MAKDDGATSKDPGDSGAQRAVRSAAALHDAVRALADAQAGQRPAASDCERLGILLVQTFNQLLSLAEAADLRHGTRFRFDVIGGLDFYYRELAAAGISRGGEGGLSLAVEALKGAHRERPSATSRSLREAAGACALLTAWLARAFLTLGKGNDAPPARSLPPEPPKATAGPTFSAQPPDPNSRNAEADANSSGVRIWTFDPPPPAPRETKSDRPAFYA